MQKIRTALRLAREAKGKTALEVATEANTTENRLYSFERGRCTPKPDEAAQIAAALGVKLEKVFPELVHT